MRQRGLVGLIGTLISAYFLLTVIETAGKTYWPSVYAYIQEKEIPDYKFAFYASWATAFVSLIFVNSVYSIPYVLNKSFFERWKVEKEENWPWIEDPEGFKKLLRKSLRVVLTNILIIYPITLGAYMPITNYKVATLFDPKDLPGKLTIMWQAVWCFYVEDLVFSVSHRLLHSRRLYKIVHKLHHEHTNTIALTATYAHPVEYALGNMLPVGLPAFLLGVVGLPRMHLVTFLFWISLRTNASAVGHSGYEFPCMPWELLPMRGTPAYHDYHHSGGDFSGNYGGMTTVLDTLWGTNKKYYKMYKK